MSNLDELYTESLERKIAALEAENAELKIGLDMANAAATYAQGEARRLADGMTEDRSRIGELLTDLATARTENEKLREENKWLLGLGPTGAAEMIRSLRRECEEYEDFIESCTDPDLNCDGSQYAIFERVSSDPADMAIIRRAHDRRQK